MKSNHRVTGGLHLGLLLTSVVVSALMSMAPSIGAQEAQIVPPSPTPVPEPTPIPAAQIPVRAGEVSSLVREVDLRARATDSTTAIIEALSPIEERIADFEKTAARLLDADGSAEILRSARAEMAPVSDKLNGWLAELGRRAAELDADLQELQNTRDLWRLTGATSGEAGLPEALVRQIAETLRALGEAEKTAGARRNEVLTLQARVARSQSQIKALTTELRKESENRRRHLFRLDSPPIWKAARRGDQETALGDQVIESFGKKNSEVWAYSRSHTDRLALHVVLLIGLTAFFVWLRGKAELWVKSDESLRVAAALLQRPVAASLLVTVLLLDRWIYPGAPTSFLSALNAVLILVVPRLLRQMVRPSLQPAIWALVAMAVVYLVFQIVPTSYFFDRIGQLVLALAGSAAAAWLVRQLRRQPTGTETGWYRAAILGVKIAGSLFGVAVCANVVGAVGLASYLVSATLASAYDALVLWALAAVLISATTVVLRTTPVRRLRLIQYDADTVRSVIFRLISFLAVASWVFFTFEEFGFLDRILATLKKVLDVQLQLGEFTLSLSSVVIFMVVVWLAYKLSQALSFVLDRDILPRLDLGRGAPQAISKISQYLVITLGFLIAVTAAGFNLSQLTIVVGALSVGIGFGLQTIVSNFISGLILLFERPINVGDRVEIGPINGIIQDIGIRASVVRTWDGADVVVPNATLISDNVVNWTLSDPSRRMTIQVGVVYGSDPEQVIALLLEVAKDHEGVLDDPAPVALFVGFGDSALNFELRAWTVGDFLALGSELRVTINRVLADAGIAIPFPQRDLHLRSVDAGIATVLGGSNRAPRRSELSGVEEEQRVAVDDGEAVHGPVADRGEQ